MGRKKKVMNEEDDAESCCFHCKDGGTLRVCDYKGCHKAYHAECVGKDDSFLESDVSFTCRWHSCLICKHAPKFICYCCPNAVCGRCIYDSEFAVVSERKGFCSHCLTLSGFIEGVRPQRSDEEMIDFDDEETYEYMFKQYWNSLKETEGLTSEHVHSAFEKLNKGHNHEYSSELNATIYESSGGSDSESQEASDYDDTKHLEWKGNKRKSGSMEAKLQSKKKVFFKSKNEFSGWGSEALFKFLTCIGEDTTKELSQHEVCSIIIRYCKEHGLFHPVQKKKVLCDSTLQSFLRRKSVNKNRIHNLLTTHFAENIEMSEDEIAVDDEGGDNLQSSKKQKISSSDKRIPSEKVASDVVNSCFASVIAENIRCLYLKKSLVEEMSKEPETFDVKIIGSFVRVKSDPNDYSQKNPYMLVQVIGIKGTARNGEVNSDILLQVSNIPKDIAISNLSDAEFYEEECDDLRQRVKNDLIKRPTVVEFEEKAKSLHEVITKHWIRRELDRLQKEINRAHEKGWKRELAEYMDKKQLLQTPKEQSRLLNEIPKIIPDKEVVHSDKDLSKHEQGDDTGANFILHKEVEHADKNFSKKNELEQGDDTGAKFIFREEVEHADKGLSKNELEQVAGYEVASKSSACGLARSFPAETLIENTGGDEKICQTLIENTGGDEKICQRSSAEEKQQTIPSENGKPHQQSHSIVPDSNDDGGIPVMVGSKSSQEVHHACPETSHELLSEQSLRCIPETLPNARLGSPASRNQNEPEVIGDKKVEVPVIELSDDEEEEENQIVPTSKQNHETSDCPIWHCVTPRGFKSGPYSMNMLKRWNNESNGYGERVKVWRAGQSQEEAVSLNNAIDQSSLLCCGAEF